MIDNIKSESGQAMVITVLGMACLLGFAAMATDVGMMFHEKRLLQTAADSAAIAGASEINYGDVTTAATAAATTNGFTASANETVTISWPPADGPNAGKAGYVEAVITKKQASVLMRLFGFNSATISARAVAQNGGAAQGCIYVMSPNAADAMQLQGSFDVSAPTCGIEVNSSNSDALQFTGAGGTLTAGSIGVVGGDGGQTGDSTPTPVTGIAPFSDPITDTPPQITSNTTGSGKKAVTTYTATVGSTTVNCTAPTGGTLTGTITPTSSVMCYSGNVTLSNVTLGNATYVFTGPSSDSVTMGGKVTAGASTIDIDEGTLSLNTGTTLNLTAPTSGPFNGIVLMQPSSNSSTITLQSGDSTGSLTGIIWAPTAELFMQDSGGDKKGVCGALSLTTDLIIGTLYDKTTAFCMTSYSQSVGTSPLTRVALVE